MKILKNIIQSTVILYTLCIILSCNDDARENHPELQPFFEVFAEEAALRGFDFNANDGVIIGKLLEIINPAVHGQCSSFGEGPKEIIIDKLLWETKNYYEREFLIFHELGHCFLNRPHLSLSNPDGTCVSIMQAGSASCILVLNEDNRKEYLDELFDI